MNTAVLLFSLATGLITFYSDKKFNLGPIRSSTTCSLILIGFVYLVRPLDIFETELIANAIFGASFVGMSSHQRFKYLDVCIASCIFAMLFCYLVPFLDGLGGALGFSALLSTVFTKVFFRIPLIRRQK